MSDLDLARRALACPRWRWMEGMREATGCRAGLISQDGMVEASTHRSGNDQPRAVVHVVDVGGSNNGWARALPDLDDPATIGCLLALVREAWSRPFLCALYTLDGHWYVHDMGASFSPHLLALEGIEAPSEAAALVAALESAP